MLPTAAQKLDVVRKYVADERVRRGIKSVNTDTKLEPSSEVVNEFSSLLDIQLMSTVEGFGGWTALSDVEILEGVYGEVQRRTGRY